MTLCIVAASTIASRTVARLGAKSLLVFGMTVMTIGLALFTRISTHGDYAADVLVPGMLVGIGIGFAFVPATISAVAGVAPAEAGLASGLVNTSRLFGGALGLAVLAAIATGHTNSQLHQGASAHAALTSGFQLAFVIAAAFSLIGGLVAAFGLPPIPARRTARSGTVAPESA
jgi:MFS family permease